METAQIKSLIRHALTAIGTLLVLTGLNRFIPLVEYLTENIDSTFQAIEVLVGVVVAVFGFLRNKDRFKEVAEAEAKQ
jgi:hypothetical protein